MEDGQIIELYNRRDEQALVLTREKYGQYLSSIAVNLLGDPQDAEECVSDALLAVWDRIPPEKPASLKLFAGRIVRNLSVSRYRREHAKKRFSELTVLLSELDECVPGAESPEKAAENTLLSEIISRWLRSLDPKDRALFIRRYWHGESIKSLAAECGTSPEKLTQRMLRLRRKLKAFLEKEGFEI